MCHVSGDFFFNKVVELVGGGSVINGATLSSFRAIRLRKGNIEEVSNTDIRNSALSAP